MFSTCVCKDTTFYFCVNSVVVILRNFCNLLKFLLFILSYNYYYNKIKPILKNR